MRIILAFPSVNATAKIGGTWPMRVAITLMIAVASIIVLTACAPMPGRLVSGASAEIAPSTSSTANTRTQEFYTPLRPDDCDAIRIACPDVKDVTPIIRVRTRVAYGQRNWTPNWIYGTAPAFLDIRAWTNLSNGSAFTESDVRNANKVCIIGQTLVSELFEGQSPLGREVRINDLTLTVIGVLSTKGQNFFGMDTDDILLAPWTTISSHITGASSKITFTANPTPSREQMVSADQILFSTRSSDKTPLALREVTSQLRKRHRIAPGQDDDFEVRDLENYGIANLHIILPGRPVDGVSFGSEVVPRSSEHGSVGSKSVTKSKLGRGASQAVKVNT